MSLYGIADSGSPEAHQAYREIEAVGARKALLMRLQRQRETVCEPPPTVSEPESAELPEQLRLPPFDLTAIEPSKLTVEDVQRYVAQKYNVKRFDIVSERRTEKLVAPRQVATYLCHRIFPYGAFTLGRKFRRDHSTILHSIKKVKTRVLGDSAYCLAIHQMEEELKPYAPKGLD